jgi:hypothetical protein
VTIAIKQGAFLNAETVTPTIASAATYNKGGGILQELTLTVAPNPSSTSFTLLIHNNAGKPLTLRVVDALGREVERKTLSGTDRSLRLGDQWRPGTYYAELVQGGQRRTLKLVKSTQ